MKISWVRRGNDLESFKMIKNLGFDVFDVEEPEKVDEVIRFSCS